jgi:formate-dependent nitrite reductase membrane component NrfD
MNSTREERLRRRPLVAAFVGIGLGLLFLATGLSRPSIANMRTVDLVHLLGTGACLGVGLVAVVLHFVHRREA